MGPIVAATVIGEIRDVSRFADRDHFAAYNGTAPIEVSSGRRKIYRLSRRRNRRLNHAIHMAAITQISHDSAGRSYYKRKLAEGKTPKEALRSLKRRVSDAVFAQLLADARQAAARPRYKEPGRAAGERLHRQRGRIYTPGTGSSAKPLPDPPLPYGLGPGYGRARKTTPEATKKLHRMIS